MVVEKHGAASEGDDSSERDLAVIRKANGQHSGLASQPTLQVLPSTCTSDLFQSSTLQPLAVSETVATHSKDDVTGAEDSEDEPTVASNTIRGGIRHQWNSSADPSLSINTRTISREDVAQEPRKSPFSPDSTELPPQQHTPEHPVRSSSSSRNRDRGFSLRRAILARSLHGQPESSGSAMELQPTAALAMQEGDSGSGLYKKPAATITVSPVFETVDDLKTHVQSTKNAHESLALPHYETWIKGKTAHTGLLSRLRAARERVRRKILRIQNIPPSKDGRHIDIDLNGRKPLIDERTGRRYIDNTITSSRYTLYNFLPRQLFAQFSKLANFYFLCVSILQMIPGLSTTGTYTTIVPLAFFVVISMAKEGYDDLRRYKLDKAENRKTALVLRGHIFSATTIDNSDTSTATSDKQGYWAEVKWEDVGVGDIVKLMRDEPAPADLAVLHTSGAEEMAYVETMALDGETNLKSKQALPQLARVCKKVEDIASCEAHIVVEDPNLDLYNFEGRVTIGHETLPLANKEIIYRGSVLRNTSEAVGIVVYSGQECKIRMNATKNPRIKAVSTRAF